MTQYLSRTMRNNLLFLNGMLHKEDHIIEEMSKHKPDREVLKNLRTGRTFIAKAMGAIMKTVDPKSLKQLERESLMLDVTLKHRSEAGRLYKQFYAEDREFRRQTIEELGRDPICDLAETVPISACQLCNGEKRKKGCPAYEALNALEIPEWDIDHQFCKYAGAGALVAEGS